MTRNDIAKSLKPIEWAYNHEKEIYTAILGLGGRGIELVIELLSNPPARARLSVLRDNVCVFGYNRLHVTLDSAMQEARNFLVTEVCNLFELDEQ